MTKTSSTKVEVNSRNESKTESFSRRDLEEAVEKNNDEWEKRLMLMVMIMLVAMLGLD